MSKELSSEPSAPLRELAARLREEVEARSSLGASLARSEAATPLSLLEVPLAGRHKEFGALVSEYHAARIGQTRVAVVLGEAGIGKTRLAQRRNSSGPGASCLSLLSPSTATTRVCPMPDA